jgi:hypothetical protein
MSWATGVVRRMKLVEISLRRQIGIERAIDRDLPKRSAGQRSHQLKWDDWKRGMAPVEFGRKVLRNLGDSRRKIESALRQGLNEFFFCSDHTLIIFLMRR